MLMEKQGTFSSLSRHGNWELNPDLEQGSNNTGRKREREKLDRFSGLGTVFVLVLFKMCFLVVHV